MVDVSTATERSQFRLPRAMHSFCGLTAAARSGYNAIKANPETHINKILWASGLLGKDRWQRPLV